MKVVILAAGKGERLKELTFDRPKGMVEVGGVTLIDRVFKFLNNKEVKEIAVVGGYKFEVLEKHLKSKTEKNIRIYNNPLFHEGSIRTIMTAFDFIDDDFLLMNADHIYPPKMFDSLLHQRKGITAMCDYDRNLTNDDMKVKKGPNGFLMKIRKDLSDFDCGYIGMTFIPKEKLANYKDAAKEAYEIYGKQSNVETILGHMAANDEKISLADLSGFGWLEVDTQEDKAIAEKSIKDRTDF